jgi:simple sugar transport system permease protein/ribose transport system permease protein
MSHYVRKFFKSKESWIILMIIGMIILFTAINPLFLTVDNLASMLKSNAMFIVMSMGMTLVIITGGIDVSLAAMIAAISMIVGRLIAYWGFSLILATIIAAAIGTALGSVNGVLIAKARIPAIVTTLGTSSIISGGILLATGARNQWVTASEFPLWFKEFGESSYLGMPVQVWLVVALGALTWFIMEKTMIGRSVYAIGGNMISARRVGLNVDAVTIFVYAYMGFLCGIGVIIHVSAIQLADPNSFVNLEMRTIAAVVVGGGSLVGGIGSVRGSIIGVLFMIILNNGLGLIRIDTYWRDIMVGVVLVVAVSADAIRRVREDRNIQHIDVLISSK